MKRLLLVALAAAVVLAAGSPAPPAAEPPSALAVEQEVLGMTVRPDGSTILAWFDPLSLTALPGRKVPLGNHRGAWTFSDDRSVLAVADDYKKAALRFIDARRMRVLGDLRLAARGTAWQLAWVRHDRLLAVVGSQEATQLVVVDPRARTVVRRTQLPGPVWSWATTRVPGGLILLLGAEGTFEPTRVAVVDAEGRFRVATVPQIEIGTVWNEREGGSLTGETRQPGLAVDPSGDRAFVVGAGAPVAEIDLATFEVSYHEVSERISLLGRLRNWLEPDAEGKVLSGPTRYARWVGDGLIAVSGSDHSTWTDAQGKEQFRASAAGVRLIDTRSWTVRTLDEDASSFQTGPGLIFATGGSWGSASGTRDGVGIAAYDLAGRIRYRLHGGENLWLNAAGSLGYIHLGEASERVEVVDLATGAIVRRLDRTSAGQWPYLLAASSSVP